MITLITPSLLKAQKKKKKLISISNLRNINTFTADYGGYISFTGPEIIH